MCLFDELLLEADQINKQQKFERKTAHLPGTLEEAIPFYNDLLVHHHAAMMAADVDKAIELREEAHLLAHKLNNGAPGILASDDAPGCVLERETRAQDVELPLWGQTGRFEIEAAGILIDIEMEGIFGIGASAMYWLGFSARSVCKETPFISETGYRSFLGPRAEILPGITPDGFAHKIIHSYIKHDLGGALVPQSDNWSKGAAA